MRVGWLGASVGIGIFPFFVTEPFDWRDHSRRMFLRGVAEELRMRRVRGIWADRWAGVRSARVVMMVSLEKSSAKSRSFVIDVLSCGQYKIKNADPWAKTI